MRCSARLVVPHFCVWLCAGGECVGGWVGGMRSVRVWLAGAKMGVRGRG